MRVQFTRDELYENIGRNQGHQFREGEQFDFTSDFAEKWIGLDAAVLVEGGDGADLVGTSGPFVPVNYVAPKSVPAAEPADDPVTDADPADDDAEGQPEDDKAEKLAKARADYEELFGKKPHHAAKAETLQAAIDEALAK